MRRRLTSRSGSACRSDVSLVPCRVEGHTSVGVGGVVFLSSPVVVATVYRHGSQSHAVRCASLFARALAARHTSTIIDISRWRTYIAIAIAGQSARHHHLLALPLTRCCPPPRSAGRSLGPGRSLTSVARYARKALCRPWHDQRSKPSLPITPLRPSKTRFASRIRARACSLCLHSSTACVFVYGTARARAAARLPRRSPVGSRGS